MVKEKNRVYYIGSSALYQERIREDSEYMPSIEYQDNIQELQINLCRIKPNAGENMSKNCMYSIPFWCGK